MKRGELDRDTRSQIDAFARAGIADGLDGADVIVVIALGIGGSHRRFAQHVVAVAEALGLPFARAP